MSSLRIVFIVQGEGRGHMTQALALASLIRDAGHEVSRVLVGGSPYRSLPSYFTAAIGAPVVVFDAPTQVPGSDGRGVSFVRTTWDATRRAPRFVSALSTIAEGTRDADLVVNFLDLLGGLSRWLQRPAVPSLAIAHNHVFLHPLLADAPGPRYVRSLVVAYARITAARGDRVALSFSSLPAEPKLRLEVAPPLLRAGIQTLEARDDGYLLAYTLNAGYGADLAAWHARHPRVEVHCYLDGGTGALGTKPAPGFHVHDLDQGAFLAHLAGCRAYVGSAGFESICEAFYLGKPVLAVPTEGQFEQTLNAWDAERCGIARAGSYADLDGFWNESPGPSVTAVEEFRNWVALAPGILVDAVERAAHNGHSGKDARGTL